MKLGHTKKEPFRRQLIVLFEKRYSLETTRISPLRPSFSSKKYPNILEKLLIVIVKYTLNVVYKPNTKEIVILPLKVCLPVRLFP